MAIQQQQKQKAQSIFISSIEGLANTAAVIVTFLFLPIAHGKSVGWVLRFTEEYYGDEFSGFVYLVWYVLLALMIFFGARASLSTLLIMCGVSIAVRFL